MATYSVHRSQYPVDGEYDYAILRTGDNSPTLEVYGRVGHGPEGVRDAQTMAIKICEFLNSENYNEH